MAFSFLPFVAHLLFFSVHCANSNADSASDVCPEIPRDVEKGQKGEVCYRINESSSYNFVGTKIAGELDSKIYKVDNVNDFKSGIKFEGVNPEKALAVKVVSMGEGAKKFNLAKPEVMIKHEMKMLKLMNEYEAKQQPNEQSVVRMFGGGEVTDKSNMGHILERRFSMIFIMEFGYKTLDKYLEQWDKKIEDEWKKKAKDQQMHELAEKIKKKAQELIVKLAETVQTFHKHALHLHLKPGNWVLIKAQEKATEKAEGKTQEKAEEEDEGKWKLIDLQSAIPNSKLTGASGHDEIELDATFPEEWPVEFMEFACNSIWNMVPGITELLSKPNERPDTYASPEQMGACKETESSLLTIKSEREKKMEAQLKRIGPKTDVWGFGVMMLEILAHTLQINPFEKGIFGPKYSRRDPINLFIEMRNEFVGKSGVIQNIKEFLHTEEKREELIPYDEKSARETGHYMKRIEEHFPTEYALLLRIFVKEPKDRIGMGDIVKSLTNVKMGMCREFTRAKNCKDDNELKGKKGGTTD